MVLIHGMSGSEKNLLKICPPGINKFAEIKLQLNTYKADIEKEKKIFFEKLPDLTEKEKEKLNDLKDDRDNIEVQWDEKINKLVKSIADKKWMIWKHVDLFVKKQFSKPNAIKSVEKNVEHQKSIVHKLEHEPESVFLKEQDGLIADIKRLENIMQSTDYYGAYGEIKVLNELKKLDDGFQVLCDVNVCLKDYVRYRGNRNLRSAQMDFVVVGPTGIYVIEVKNWSSNQVNHHRGLNPYEQVDRAGKVLWIYLKKHSFFYKPRVTNLLVPIQGNISYNSYYKSVLIRQPYNLIKFINGNNNTLGEKKVTEVVRILQ